MQPQKHRKHRYAAPIGGVFIFLAVLGVATVLYASIRLTARVLDNSSQKLMFENIIRPVAMFNPAPFEKAEDIEMQNLLAYSMWAALLGEKQGTYKFGETAELMVPASDLDVAAAKLFGPDLKLVHQSFDDYEMFYYYDEENSVYNVPAIVQANVYTPQVDTITKTGDLYELYVGYLPPGVSWMTDYSEGTGKPAAEKHMNYIMQKSEDGYYIVKVQEPPADVAAAQPQLQQNNPDAGTE